MSDLSWLNPTPHAIAVYASRPLSPVATQHSLPSGRYPLLGPDLHRLDRTSLRLAHSLDHLVGERENAGRNLEAERAGRVEIDDKLNLRELQNRQVRRLCALEDARGVEADLAKGIQDIRSVTDQPPGFRIGACRIDCGKSVASRQYDKLDAPSIEERPWRHEQRVGPLSHYVRERGVDVSAGSNVMNQELLPTRS